MTAQVINGKDAHRMWSRFDGSAESKDGRKKTLTVREVYQIVTEAGDDIYSPSAAFDLPRIGDPFTGTFQVRVTKRNFRQISPIFWHVDITYEGELGPDEDNNPLNDPPEISWSKVETDEAIDEDWNGNAIVTACGEPIDGVTMKISDLVMTVKRNYAGIDLAATHAYLHSVNSDTFAGFSPGTGRLTQFSAAEVWAEDFGGYWEVTAAIQFRFPYNTTSEKAWYARVRHEGYYVRDATTNKVGRAVDPRNKEPTTRPVLLNEDGTALDLPEPPTEPEAKWLEFQRYDTLPYNSLGLL
jgi:hypothetical protein